MDEEEGLVRMIGLEMYFLYNISPDALFSRSLLALYRFGGYTSLR